MSLELVDSGRWTLVGARRMTRSGEVVLGYDHVSDDYKVMRVVQFDTFDNEVKVYNVKSNSWRRVKDFPFCQPYKHVNGLLVSGALHWVVRRDPESKANLVSGFDLGSEEYRLILLPEFSDEDFHKSVNELRGCLCVVCNYHFLYADIWVMKVYGVKESWTKLFSVAQPRDIDSFEYLSGGGESYGKKRQVQEQKKKKKNLKKRFDVNLRHELAHAGVYLVKQGQTTITFPSSDPKQTHQHAYLFQIRCLKGWKSHFLHNYKEVSNILEVLVCRQRCPIRNDNGIRRRFNYLNAE
ncbi:hypothetical protein RJ640_013716 [Escallonia rubra]|uniref:F-box associated beta-propeller type 1 domain-containing protein n=1 Tax=Escallonia rubra TaxID=112253 RepID=A0AA88R302_9ASTE|nr:hypothetical protein RJ640_013716 [Escallonia rubra]